LSFATKVDCIRNKGIDIRAEKGAAVKAARSGRVVFRDDKFSGFGRTLIIDHEDGYQTVYSYASEILVKAGDEVRQHDIIARVGRTGRAKEPCLHFEIRKNGEPQNPYYYLP
jgi:lipoprotein NlpD